MITSIVDILRTKEAPRYTSLERTTGDLFQEVPDTTVKWGDFGRFSMFFEEKNLEPLE
jgi:hypothetical protein